MTTILWSIGLIAFLEIAFHVPWIAIDQLRRLRVSWHERLTPPTSNRVLLAYRLRQVKICLLMMAVQAGCLSWVVFAGLYSGAIAWLASIVGACR